MMVNSSERPIFVPQDKERLDVLAGTRGARANHAVRFRDLDPLAGNLATAANILATLYDQRIVAFNRQSGSDHILTSTTNWQPVFDLSPNAEIEMQSGIYEFSCGLHVTSMSATSGNAIFGFGGTASFGLSFSSNYGSDVLSGAPSAIDGRFTNDIPESDLQEVLVPTTATRIWTRIEGVFRVTVAGTVQPRIKLTTAAAAVVRSGSFILVRQILSGTDRTKIGNWT